MNPPNAIKTLLASTILATLVVGSGHAQNLVVNGSFETNTFVAPIPGGYAFGPYSPTLGSSSINNWSWSSSEAPYPTAVRLLDQAIDFEGAAGGQAAFDGNYAVSLEGATSWISQTITLAAGKYQLSFAASWWLPGALAVNPIYASLGGTNFSYNNSTNAFSPTAGYSTYTFDLFTLATGGSYELKIAANNPAGGYSGGTAVDNVVFSIINDYWAPGVGGGGTGTWSAGGTNWAATAGTQGSGTQSTNTTLFFGNTAGTVTVNGGVNVAAGMTFSTDGYTVTDSTITLTGTNAAANTITTAASVGATVSSQLAGSGGMTKAGTGTLTFGGSAANTLTGTTIVSAGTLQLNKSASTTAIAGNLELANGATLLISQSEQVNNTSAVTLSGGTIIRGGGVSEVFGSLNLTAASFLDFGTGATGSMTFGTYEENTTPSALLTVQNFLPGNSFTFSNALFAADGSNIGSYFSFGTGYINSSIINNGGSSFTITAIPEPSTILAAIGLAGLMLWPAHRRFMPTRRAGFWCRRP